MITQHTPPHRMIYAFIDGGYLRHRFYEQMLGMFGEVPDLALDQLREFLRASRVFFYDCEPEETDGDAPLSDLLIWTKRQFQNIRKADYFRLRLGTLSRSGKKRANQKEVDVLLAVELLSNAYDGNMDEALLLAGDLDFRPVVEAVVQRRTFVRLVYDNRSISEELKGCADVRQSIAFYNYHGWADPHFRKSHPIPVMIDGSSIPGNSRCMRSGLLEGRRVELLIAGRDSILAIPDSSSASGRIGYITQENTQFLIQKFAPAVVGPIEWTGN